MKLDFSFVSKGAFFANHSGVWIWSNLLEFTQGPVQDIDIRLYPFFSDQVETVRFSNLQRVTLLEFSQWVDHHLANHAVDSNSSWMQPDVQKFKQQIEGIHLLIQEEKIYKAVACDFAIKEEKITSSQVLIYLKNLLTTLQTNSSLWGYGYWSTDGGVVGLTPELLFYRKNNLVQTMALAGTQAVVLGQDQSLLSDPKERAEHQAVIDDISQQLNNLGELKWDQTKVVELPQLRHLKTELSLKLNKPTSTQQLIDLLHPTAALGVYPRSYGIDFLKTWQAPQLKKYHGGVMHLNIPNEGEYAVVMIRNVQWNQLIQWVAVGMGIVKASNSDREWAEWLLKFKMIQKTLILGREGAT